ncbi:hypothetical protein ON010_g4484 [Phytophthora cinnamomi]|nr:hypothetical protein ON010_g4484 [Phytophthora cinnamomi]
MGTWGVISSAVMMFASTNIDDALILVVYFANAAEGKDGLKAQHVWSGQLLGFSIIMAISLVGTFIGSFVPPHYSGLLGIVPLWMGLQRMREWWKTEDELITDALKGGGLQNPAFSSKVCPRSPGKGPHKMNADDAKESASGKWQNSVTTKASETETEEELLSCMRIVLNTVGSERINSVFTAQSLMIAAVTLGNGGDNVAVYVPGLVTYAAGDVVITLCVFYALVVAWIFAAGRFVSFRIVAKVIEKYGDYIVPIALVALGIYILSPAGLTY